MNFKTTSIVTLFSGLALLSGCSESQPDLDITAQYEACERAATANERTRILNAKFRAPNGIIWLPETREEARRETIIKCLKTPTA